jgi:plasmid stabilization system protein ParE
MPRINPTRLALLDLERLRLFLHEKNLEASERAAKILRDGINKIAAYPEGYKPVQDMPFHRDAVIGFGSSGYIVRYHYKPGGDIIILRIRHQKENHYPDLDLEDKIAK